MKAAVVYRYGPPDHVRIVDRPSPAPGHGDVLVQMHAASVNSGDARVRGMDVPAGMALPFRLAMGWHGPRQPILGTEGAGVVVAAGAGVSRFAVGDAVVVFPGMAMGCHAEQMVIHETGRIIAKPARLSMVEAACMMFGGLTALDFLHRKAGLRRGEQVLIIGAAGTVGSAGVQVARLLGAQVTGVASTTKLGVVQRLGAHAVVDYCAGPIPVPQRRYDVILDCVGALPYAAAVPLLASGGRLIKVWASLREMLLAPVTGRRNGHRVIAGVSAESRTDMATLAHWAAAGAYCPLLGSITPFAQIADAHRIATTGHKTGSAAVVFAAAQTPA